MQKIFIRMVVGEFKNLLNGKGKNLYLVKIGWNFWDFGLLRVIVVIIQKEVLIT